MFAAHQQPEDAPKTIVIRGRRREYLERRRVGRRDYYLLEKIGSPFRQRFLAFDPRQGPGGNFFLFQVLPAGPTTQQQLRIAKRLKEDSLPRVVEWERHGNDVEAVFTWIDGITLAEYLENIRKGRRPPVSPRESVRLIHGLANAVSKLHNKEQIAHGDIQPPNVIVTDHPSRLILIDFGSAWPTEQSAFREAGDGLHRCYAPPELQREGRLSGFLADQFSVSVLFYELLTLQLPYDGLGGKAGRPEYVQRAKDSLIAPSKVSPKCRDLPRSLQEGVDRVVMRGLALEPNERYPDRHAWVNDLFEVYARFRLAPELSPAETLLTRVIHWFVKPRHLK
jgi:serine/threonine protein kinase